MGAAVGEGHVVVIWPEMDKRGKIATEGIVSREAAYEIADNYINHGGYLPGVDLEVYALVPAGSKAGGGDGAGFV